VRIFCDTSIFVRAFVQQHEHYERASEVLRRVKTGEDRGYVALHTLAETYAVLTAMTSRPRLSPTMVESLITENILQHFSPLMLTPADYIRALRALVARSLIGGITYDALVLESARIVAPERFYTFNPSDFLRVAPEWAHIICEP
jgi:predicted nucleic acid-binding protein